MLRNRFAATVPLPNSFPSNEIGLMTRQEFLEYQDKYEKHHPPSAYNWDVLEMNEPMTRYLGYMGKYSYIAFSDGIKVTERGGEDGVAVGIIHDGVLYYESTKHGRGIPENYFEDRLGAQTQSLGIRARKQVKYLSEIMPLISPIAKINARKYPVILQRTTVKGEPLTLRAQSPLEVDRGISLAAVNAEGLIVAVAQNEYGASLLAVAREYRGKGVGKILGKIWFEWNPSWRSGGFTEAGQQTALSIWEARVKEFKARGWYTEMLRSDRITMGRVQKILQGLSDGKRNPRSILDVPVDKKTDSGEVLVLSRDSFVVVYNSLFYKDQDERFIYGYALIEGSRRSSPYIYAIDYERPYAEMTTRAILQLARDIGQPRLRDKDGYSDFLEIDGIPGLERDGDYLVVTRDVFPLQSEAQKERQRRGRVDPYGEILYMLQEEATAKWQ